METIVSHISDIHRSQKELTFLVGLLNYLLLINFGTYALIRELLEYVVASKILRENSRTKLGNI